MSLFQEAHLFHIWLGGGRKTQRCFIDHQEIVSGLTALVYLKGAGLEDWRSRDPGKEPVGPSIEYAPQGWYLSGAKVPTLGCYSLWY